MNYKKYVIYALAVYGAYALYKHLTAPANIVAVDAQ